MTARALIAIGGGRAGRQPRSFFAAVVRHDHSTLLSDVRAGDRLICASDPGWLDDGMYLIETCGFVCEAFVKVRTKAGRLRKKVLLPFGLWLDTANKENRPFRVISIQREERRGFCRTLSPDAMAASEAAA